MSTAEELDPPTVLDLARRFAARGWRPFPVEYGGKRPAVGIKWGTATAVAPTDGMLTLWFDRAPVNIGIAAKGSGLVILDEDELGAMTRLCEAYGQPVPVTYRVRTAKGWHWYFRAPAGMVIGNAAGLLAGFGFDVRGGKGDGGYVVAAGSVHESGHVYEAEDGAADTAELPGWIGLLLTAPGPDAEQADPDAEQPESDRERRYTMDQAVEWVQRYAVGPLRAAGEGSRNNALNTAAVVAGHFVPAFWSQEWATERLTELAAEVGLDEVEILPTIRSGMRTGMEQPYTLAADRDPFALAPDSSDQASDLLDGGLLPREIWDRSPVLRHIYQAAMATLTCPDAVLYSVLTIIASYLHHGSRVQTGVRPSVLSYFFVAIGMSGGGKSEALSVARDLLEQWCAERFAIHGAEGYYDGPVGSGEGLVEAFMGEVQVKVLDPETKEPVLDDAGNPKTKKGRGQARYNALFHSDEGRQVLAIDSRKGATVLAVLCEMWSGSVAGQTNADKDRTRKLGRGTYVLGLLLGFQPATIDALFDDAAGGAPQRFMFAPVAYPPHADAETFVEWPGPLMPAVPVSAVTVELKAEHRAEVRTHRRLKAAGQITEENPLDGHRMLLRVRTAALLALLHGVTAVDDELWELAGLMVDRSCALRDHLARQAQRRVQEARRARQDEAVELSGRVSVADEHRNRVQRAADSLVRFLERHGETTRGTALNGISRAVRHLGAEAELKLINEGAIRTQDGRLSLS